MQGSTSKTSKIMINHIFMMNQGWRISGKNNKPHIFTPPRPLGSGGVKIWGLLFFLNNVKIENNDFIIILDYANLNGIMPTTNYCSNPTEKFLAGSVTHIESPWTLNITPILLNASGDLILGLKNLKNRFITILDVFASGSLHEVVYLSPGIIRLWFIFTNYLIFLMGHTHHMYPSYPTTRWALVSRLSWTPSNMVFRPFST